MDSGIKAYIPGYTPSPKLNQPLRESNKFSPVIDRSKEADFLNFTSFQADAPERRMSSNKENCERINSLRSRNTENSLSDTFNLESVFGYS